MAGVAFCETTDQAIEALGLRTRKQRDWTPPTSHIVSNIAP